MLFFLALHNLAYLFFLQAALISLLRNLEITVRFFTWRSLSYIVVGDGRM